MMLVLKAFLTFIFVVVLIVQLDKVTFVHERQWKQLAEDGFHPFLSLSHVRNCKKQSPAGSFKHQPRPPGSTPSVAVRPASAIMPEGIDSGETTGSFWKKGLVSATEEVLDCCRKCGGYDGGYLSEAFRYFVKVGVTWDEGYPFLGFKEDCRPGFKIAAKAETFRRIKNSEAAMVQALHHSPLVVSLNCPSEIKRYYKGGVAHPDCADDICSCTHAVVIVGHGEGYWIIRNTWGEEFGESGHFLLKKGICGVGRKVWSVTLDDPTQDQHVSEKKNTHWNGVTMIAKIFQSYKKTGMCA